MKLFERLEEALEKRDRLGYAGRLRLLEYIFTIVTAPKKRGKELKWRDERESIFLQGFALLQREIYLEEKEMAALEKKAMVEAKQITEWKDGWQDRNKAFWLFKRYLQLSSLERPNGPLTRQWVMLGKDEYYYSARNKKLCAARGGCCGRGCGCCQKLLKGPHGLSLRAHCTMECGCCIGSRGFRSCEWRSQEAPTAKDFMVKIAALKVMKGARTTDARAISTEAF